jgi:hypothetical protein
MGTLIKLPESARGSRSVISLGNRTESATVIILPVIRIERFSTEPSGPNPGQGRRRRRRISRT